MDLKNSGRSCLLTSLLMIIGVLSRLPELSPAEHRADVAGAPIPDDWTDLLEDWYRDECAREKENPIAASDHLMPAWAVQDPVTVKDLHLLSRPVAGSPPVSHHLFHIAPENEMHDAHSQTDSPTGTEADSNRLLEHGSNLWNTHIITDAVESDQRQITPHPITSTESGTPETSTGQPSSHTTPANARPHILALLENPDTSPLNQLTQLEPRRRKRTRPINLSDQSVRKQIHRRKQDQLFAELQIITSPVESDHRQSGPHRATSTRSGAPETSAGLPSSHTTPADAWPHILALPGNSDKSPLKQLTQPEPRRHTRTRRPKLIAKPVRKRKLIAKPVRKRIHSRKKDQLFAEFCARHSLENSIPLNSDTQLNPHLASSLRSTKELTEANRQQDMMKFDAELFVPLDPFNDVEKAEIKHFRDKINSLPSKLMILPEDDFFFLRLLFRYRDFGQKEPTEAQCQHPEKTSLTKAQSPDPATEGLTQGRPAEYTEAVRRTQSILGVFDETHVKSWYQRWLVTTGVNLRISSKGRMFDHFSDDRYKDRMLPLYLLYVEMICSIVREESTTSKQIADELISAREQFVSLTKASLEPAKIKGNPTFKRMAKKLRTQVMSSNRYTRYAYAILWTYLHHWMLTKRHDVFECSPSKSPAHSVKEIFNNVFVYTYSSLYQKYAVKEIG
ncbi:hypothetical protein PCANC_25315 [Puccinia coronata f. sp. avenae]|uniref:Uncharacterized protein n=1 Tax=Puccinia coronata f. sp. avenae TaxID=200324 RepID=A0A2N5TKK7_9BASI|nr:hypothetical protein PCANC_25315 [Puccinia coronata f. sp. avenae]